MTSLTGEATGLSVCLMTQGESQEAISLPNIISLVKTMYAHWSHHDIVYRVVRLACIPTSWNVSYHMMASSLLQPRLNHYTSLHVWWTHAQNATSHKPTILVMIHEKLFQTRESWYNTIYGKIWNFSSKLEAVKSWLHTCYISVCVHTPHYHEN